MPQASKKGAPVAGGSLPPRRDEDQQEVEFCVLQVLRDEKTPPSGQLAAIDVLAAVGSKNSLDAIKPLQEDPALSESARRAVAAIEARKK